MKNLIFLFLLFCSVKIYSQETIPPQGADRIVIKNNESSANNFLLVKKVLAEKRIKIAHQNADLFKIKTKELKISKSGTVVHFDILCKDNEIQIEGGVKPGMVMYIGGKEFKDAYFKVSYDEVKFNRDGVKLINMLVESFDTMDALAKALGSPVIYLTSTKSD